MIYFGVSALNSKSLSLIKGYEPTWLWAWVTVFAVDPWSFHTPITISSRHWHRLSNRLLNKQRTATDGRTLIHWNLISGPLSIYWLRLRRKKEPWSFEQSLVHFVANSIWSIWRELSNYLWEKSRVNKVRC